MPPLTRPARRRARPGASCRVHPRVVSRLRQPTGRPKRTGRRSHSARRSAIVAMTSWLMTCESNTGRQDRATWPGVLSISSETDRLASMGRWQQAAAVAALPAAHRPCPPSRRRRTVAHRSGSARAAVLPNKHVHRAVSGKWILHFPLRGQPWSLRGPLRRLLTPGEGWLRARAIPIRAQPTTLVGRLPTPT